MRSFLFACFVTGTFSLALRCPAQRGITRPVLSAAPAQVAAGQAAPATGAAATGIPGGPATDSSYVLGVGDSIQITVWKEPGSSAPSVPIRPDGMISLGLVGDVRAAGKTPKELGDEIASRLKQYITDPRVTVTLLSVQPKEIYLLGEVLHVGPIPITPEMTPLQAIAAGGGLTPYANSRHIYILRTEAGKQRKIPFDYKKAIKDGNIQGVSLVAGDTIVVP